MLLVSVGVKALAAGGSITLTYPSSAETHVSVDEFAGVTGIDGSAGAAGTTAAFSSGTATATQAADVLIGLRQAGVEIASVSVDKPTLDEVFLALTGHDTAEAEELVAVAA